MQELLKQNNTVLRHEIEQLRRSLTDVQGNIPDEFHAYTERITNECDILHQRVLRNLEYLEFGLRKSPQRYFERNRISNPSLL